MQNVTNKRFGALGEKHAAEYLKKRGYKILDKNYKNKLGEIDLIVRIGGTVAFIEVKTRSAGAYLSGQYAVDKRKQFHIMRTAARWLDDTKSPLQPRFDVIEIEMDRQSGKPVSVNHIKAAFAQTESYARF